MRFWDIGDLLRSELVPASWTGQRCLVLKAMQVRLEFIAAPETSDRYGGVILQALAHEFLQFAQQRPDAAGLAARSSRIASTLKAAGVTIPFADRFEARNMSAPAERSTRPAGTCHNPAGGKGHDRQKRYHHDT
jgi:hypothetical protein